MVCASRMSCSGTHQGTRPSNSLGFSASLLESSSPLGDLTIHKRVTVGTAIAHRPPHRSRRAELPHWAPTLGFDAETHVGNGCRRRAVAASDRSSITIRCHVSRLFFLRHRGIVPLPRRSHDPQKKRPLDYSSSPSASGPSPSRSLPWLTGEKPACLAHHGNGLSTSRKPDSVSDVL